MMHATRPARTGPRGFTLIELLVVITIIALISAIALPTILPALNERRVSESARVLQAILAGRRDAAIRANAPRGIRLLPDPIFNGLPDGNGGFNPLASNRVIPIEPGPDYTEGLVRQPTQYFPNITPQTQDPSYLVNTLPNGSNPPIDYYLRISESGYSPGPSSNVNTTNNPTNWFNNLRQGDKLRFNDSGPYYTVAGPVDGLPATNNPERFIIGKLQGTKPLYTQAGWVPEYLFLTNGQDDNNNGWIDESCDGIDNDGDGITDPGFNGIDDNGDGVIDDPRELYIGKNINDGNGLYSGTEYEKEVFLGAQASTPPNNEAYTVFRRPVVSPGAQEVTLPAGVVIDLTTYNASAASIAGYPVLLPERSRLPVDTYTRYVDVMIDQTGRAITPGAGMDGGKSYGNSPLANFPFYHFWLTEREGVVPPMFGYAKDAQGNPINIPRPNPYYVSNNGTPPSNLLPMPGDTTGYTPTGDTLGNPIKLIGERRLVTLFVKTGQITSNSITSFDALDTNRPYYDAQSGIKEPQ